MVILVETLLAAMKAVPLDDHDCNYVQTLRLEDPLNSSVTTRHVTIIVQGLQL